MLSYCNFCIYTHPTFKMYSMTMIWYLHYSYIMFVHRRLNGQHSNRRTYLKFLEMTFLAMDFYLVKEVSIYNIFEIWVFSSLLIYTSIYILKMVRTPWALLTSCSWINKILSDVISRLLWPWTFPECQVSVGDFDPQTLIRNSLHVLRHAVLDGNHKHTKSL